MRITVPTVKVLRVLLADPHAAFWGLEIVKKTDLLTGTVYPIMDRLESLGWVTSEWEADNDRNGPRRRYYKLRPEAIEEAEATLVKYTETKKLREEQAIRIAQNKAAKAAR